MVLNGNYADLHDMALSRDWKSSDIYRLGLLRYRVYEAMVTMSERQIGGVLARGRIIKGSGGFYRLAEDGLSVRRVKGAEPGFFGLGEGEALLSKGGANRTFYICRPKAPGQYWARFANGKREVFELHLPDFYVSAQLLERIKNAGLWVSKEKP